MSTTAKVTSHSFKLKLKSMTGLSIKELTNICLITSQQILMYYRDIMLGNSPHEQTVVTKYMLDIQHILTVVEEIDVSPSRVPSINIKHFSLIIHNNGVTTEMPFKLEPAYFQILGPIGMMKVLDDVLSSALSSIPLTHLMHPQVMRISYARIQCAMIPSILARLAPRIPDSSAYSVQHMTDLHSIDLNLEVKYD
jgi:hypothetical protein